MKRTYLVAAVVVVAAYFLWNWWSKRQALNSAMTAALPAEANF
jgi:hypothetical protein